MSEREKSESEVIVGDRISSLPDSLLHHILSFLPTREVVATSLLSKRWRPLWHSMRTFDFEDRAIYRRDFFIQFVDAVLLMADSKPIEKFRLKCLRFFVQLKGKSFEYKSVPSTRINIWISTVIHRKVEHFELCFDYNEYIVAPSSIFNCSTIRVLKLDRARVNVPSSVRLPSLKVMHLVKVKLPNYECLANLLSGCAFLQELVLDLGWDDGGGGGEEEKEDREEGEVEEEEEWEEEEEEEWEEEEEEEGFTLNIEKLEHLVSASVPSFLITSKALTNVTHLQLNVDESPVRDTPKFDKLTHLKISSLDDEHLNWIVECLRSSPKLESLVINEIYVGCGWEGALIEPKLDVPQCLSSHLKEFTLGGYLGWECEFEIARYIMENARVLRTITILCGDDIDASDKYNCLIDLASCPRGSENCRLLFS
ncbi:hypothetical protein QN277_024968 [Acacia crassicarpa]|nr:hypothetical protein QN277_024968 [Acacia crassicarpa]